MAKDNNDISNEEIYKKAIEIIEREHGLIKGYYIKKAIEEIKNNRK